MKTKLLGWLLLFTVVYISFVEAISYRVISAKIQVLRWFVSLCYRGLNLLEWIHDNVIYGWPRRFLYHLRTRLEMAIIRQKRQLPKLKSKLPTPIATSPIKNQEHKLLKGNVKQLGLNYHKPSSS